MEGFEVEVEVDEEDGGVRAGGLLAVEIRRSGRAKRGAVPLRRGVRMAEGGERMRMRRGLGISIRGGVWGWGSESRFRRRA